MKELNEIDFIRQSLLNSENNAETSPVIGYISKMIPIQRKLIGEPLEPGKDGDEIVFMPFARVYSGTIRKGESYYIIGPKHNPKNNNYDIKKIVFDDLYIIMGQYLEPVDEVPPGNIFSISNMENHVFKSATISSLFDCPSILPTNINVINNLKILEKLNHQSINCSRRYQRYVFVASRT